MLPAIQFEVIPNKDVKDENNIIKEGRGEKMSWNCQGKQLQQVKLEKIADFDKNLRRTAKRSA